MVGSEMELSHAERKIFTILSPDEIVSKNDVFLHICSIGIAWKPEDLQIFVSKDLILG